MTISAKEMRRHVDVVLRALDILDCFQSRPVLTVKEIVELTGMTRSRAMRLAGTLVSRGYLIYESEGRRFCLGMQVFTLGKVFEAHNTLVTVSRPILRELVQSTGELASLYVIDGLERVALAREKGSHEISYSVAEGQRMELYAGAAGKVLLAFAPPEISDKVVKKGFLKKLTPTTISDPRQLAEELAQIRRKGYAVSRSERAADVWSAAAPVFGAGGKSLCAVGITGPSYRIPRRAQAAYVKLVVAQAREMSRRLEGRESPQKKEDMS